MYSVFESGSFYLRYSYYCFVYYNVHSVVFFFFFQAEDGIRDVAVTGVQTCALPISIRLIGSCTADHHVRVNRPENWFPIVAQQLQDSFGSPRSSSAPTSGE